MVGKSAPLSWKHTACVQIRRQSPNTPPKTWPKLLIQVLHCAVSKIKSHMSDIAARQQTTTKLANHFSSQVSQECPDRGRHFCYNIPGMFFVNGLSNEIMGLTRDTMKNFPRLPIIPAVVCYQGGFFGQFVIPTPNFFPSNASWLSPGRSTRSIACCIEQVIN